MEPGDAEMEDPAVLRYVRVVAAYEGKGYEVEVGDVLAVVDEKPATGWYGGFKLSDPEHTLCWFPVSYVRQVKLKPKFKSASIAVSAALRFSQGTVQAQRRPQPAVQVSADSDPEPRMDPAKRDQLRAEEEASKKGAQQTAQKKAAKDVSGRKQLAVSESATAPGARKHPRGSAGLGACCGTPQTDKAARTRPAVQATQQDEDAEPPVDMDHRRQHIDRSSHGADRQPTANKGDALNISVATSPDAASPVAATAAAPATTAAAPAAAAAAPAAVPGSTRSARTGSSTPPRMTRAGLAARMEQARALSPRRTGSGVRSSTPPRSGTPPRRKVITSDELDTKIQALRA